MNLELHQLDFRYEAMRDRCPVQERRLLSSLATLGQLSPIMVLDPSVPGDSYIILDGFRRTRALRELGRDTVSALALQYQEPAGKPAPRAYHIDYSRHTLTILRTI